MNGIIIACLAFASIGALAAAPPYYPMLHGTVMSGLLERDNFDFTPGTLENCSITALHEIDVFNCEVKGVTAKVSNASGKMISVTFDKVWIANARGKDGWTWEYRFRTKYQDATANPPLSSEVTLQLWHFDKAPDDIKGSFGLTAYGVVGGIQASRVPQ